ncbi:hypothetical protein ACIOUE_37900 [Streptomyces xanthochromogenes]|uniref:hypothetical protein n=1 Tax=Streptomyces xanthochromogenes TaxID=67384 RepID=UPI003818B123
MTSAIHQSGLHHTTPVPFIDAVEEAMAPLHSGDCEKPTRTQAGDGVTDPTRTTLTRACSVEGIEDSLTLAP